MVLVITIHPPPYVSLWCDPVSLVSSLMSAVASERGEKTDQEVS